MFRRRQLTDVRTQEVQICRLATLLLRQSVDDVESHVLALTRRRHKITSLRLSLSTRSTLHQMQGTLQQEMWDFPH